MLKMLKTWLHPRSIPPLSSESLLCSSLDRDLGSTGYTEITWGVLPTGWTLQIGAVPYDWQLDSGTLYRCGSPFLQGLHRAGCHQNKKAPGLWSLTGTLDDRSFEYRFSARRWEDADALHSPYRAWSVRPMVFYWRCCFVAEFQRRWDGQPITQTINFEPIEDDVTGIVVFGSVIPLEGKLLFTCHEEFHNISRFVLWDQPEVQLQDPGKATWTDSDCAQEHMAAMDAQSLLRIHPGTLSLREHFRQHLLRKAQQRTP